MKKVIYSVALVASLVGLTACGETSDSKTKEEKTETTTSAEETIEETAKEESKEETVGIGTPLELGDAYLL